MWQARLYYDTGFNSINVPDSENTLIAASSNIRTFNTMDILQRYFLSKITIRAFEDDVITADYLKIYDENNEKKYAFYSITGYNMTSGDVVDLAVVMDPLLTCGGIDNIDFTDGMTRRHHVHDEQDVFGAYQEDDPLLIPTRVYCAQAGGYGDITDDMSIIAISNYEIYEDSVIKCNNNRHLNVISDGNNGYTISSQQDEINDENNDIPIFRITPERIPRSGTKMDIGTPFGIYQADKNVLNSYGDIYHVFKCKTSPLNGEKSQLEVFMNIVNRLIEYGRNDIIKNVYLVPMRIMQSQGYGDFSNPKGKWSVGYNREEGPCLKISNNLISHIVFDNEHGTIPDPVRNYYDATYTDLMYIDQDYAASGTNVSTIYECLGICNKRVFYGKHFAYTFVSPTSGEKCTINPEQLNANPVVSLDNPAQDNLPYIAFTADIRENGRPTFYIYTYGDSDVEVQSTPVSKDVYRRVPKYKINGSTWPTMSISTIAARNYAINRDTYQFNAEASAIKSAMQMYHDINPIGDAGVMDTPAALMQMANNATKPTNEREVLGAYMGAQDRMGYATPILPSAAVSEAIAGSTLALNIANREIEKASEREQFITANLPQVEVISKSSGDGIVTPNGLLIYRNYIDKEDVKKFDRILNQFGYKITEPMKKEFLNNKPLYNYVEVSGAQVVAKNVPKSVRKDLANLFSTGVRIWHWKPDYDYSKENHI